MGHPSNNEHNVLFAPTLQQLHQSLNPEAGNVPIAWWLLAFGLIQLVLSQIPTMHHLRHLNAVATIMTVVWTVMVAAECFRTGAHVALSSRPAACYPVEQPAQLISNQFAMHVIVATNTDERLKQSTVSGRVSSPLQARCCGGRVCTSAMRRRQARRAPRRAAPSRPRASSPSPSPTCCCRRCSRVSDLAKHPSARLTQTKRTVLGQKHNCRVMPSPVQASL